MAYTKQGGSRTFTELLKNAGLTTPFEESCLRGVSEAAKAWLDSYDLTGPNRLGGRGASARLQ